jgi:hypothetical protein
MMRDTVRRVQIITCFIPEAWHAGKNDHPQLKCKTHISKTIANGQELGDKEEKTTIDPLLGKSFCFCGPSVQQRPTVGFPVGHSREIASQQQTSQ